MIDGILQDLAHRQKALPPVTTLTFLNRPHLDDPEPLPTASHSPNAPDPLALSFNDPVNTLIIDHELWLCQQINQLESVQFRASDHGGEQARRNVVESLNQEFGRIQRNKLDVWIAQQTSQRRDQALDTIDLTIRKPKGSTTLDTCEPTLLPSVDQSHLGLARYMSFYAMDLGFDKTLLATYLLAAILHILCGLSIDDCSVLLPFLQLIIGLASNQQSPPLPRDIRTVIDTLDLKPAIRRYVCCPKCCKIYRIHSAEDSTVPVTCTHRTTSQSDPCGAPLVRMRRIYGRERRVFLREYQNQDMKEWLASILCRPGVEDTLDRTTESFDGKAPADGVARDIFDGTTLRGFCGPDKEPFLGQHGSEGRYIFSLSADAWNPEGNSRPAAKYSSTAIYMALLNFPPGERYKVKNMFLVGVIPGPKEPSLDQMNHFLEPLVGDLQEFWVPGVWYSSTPRYSNGRLVRCALVPLICDLKAARQVAGHASHSAALFCAFCLLDRTEGDINRLDIENFPPRTFEKHKEHALAWKNAHSESERELEFRTHYTRWSVLLDLPYWDSQAFTLIDSMHTILLGNLERHCKTYWKMNITVTDGDGIDVAVGNAGSSRNRATGPSEDKIDEAFEILKFHGFQRFSAVSSVVLRALCDQLGITFQEPRDRDVRIKLLFQLSKYVCIRFLRI